MNHSNENLKKKKQIIEDYNSTAEIYDRRYHKIQKQKFEIVLKDLSCNHSILLDAGCGTGLLVESIINLIIDKNKRRCYYLGVDISWKMLNIFKNKDSNLRFNGLLNLIQSDIENLPFRENISHSTLAVTSIQNLSSVKKGIQELLRVGKANSIIRLSILNKKIDFSDLVQWMESKIRDYTIIKKDSLEDIIIHGKIS